MILKVSIFVLQNKKQNAMLPNKSKTIISEIQVFFTSSEKAVATLTRVISSLTISKNLFTDKVNTKYTGKNVLTLLLLFPLFQIKDASSYKKSTLYNIVNCGKDVFYRFVNDCAKDWRAILYHINMQLIRRVEHESCAETVHNKCLIVDDTDMPKTGRRIELIGRVFSHVTKKSILAFKGLFLCYHDGKSIYSIDYSIHGEKGKNKKKPFGMTKSALKQRYSKKRDMQSKGKGRVDEYIQSKISSMIEMVRHAIKKGIRFNYLLADSWFTCYEVVHFIKTRRIKCHFLGMIKMGKTKYSYNGQLLTSKEIADDLRRKKKVKKSNLYKCYYSEAIVLIQDIEVKLFFCKTSRKGKWNGLLSTNTELSFEEAYKIYSTRWVIEVYFKESKQHLGLGKCQSQDFDAQIAYVALCMLQYNLLSVVKRLNAYETMGALFREIQAESLELTIAERIHQIITELMMELAEIFDADIEMLMENFFSENERLMKLLNYKPLMQAG